MISISFDFYKREQGAVDRCSRFAKGPVDDEMDEIRNGAKMAAAGIPSLSPYSDRSGHVPVLDPSIATFSKDIFVVGSSLSAFLHSPLLSILHKRFSFQKAFPVRRISQINICPST